MGLCYKGLKNEFQGTQERVRNSRVKRDISVRPIDVVVVLLFYVHGKHLRSCRDGQINEPHFSLAGLDLSG